MAVTLYVYPTQTFVLIKRKVLLYSTWFPDKQFIQSIGLRTTGNSHQAGTNRGRVQQAGPARNNMMAKG